VKSLKVAVVGAGRLGGFHAEKLARNQRAELLAVVDPVPENRNRVAQQCATEARAGYHELLDQLDGVVIATPTRLHHKLALDFLNHGIHVLVEKPICSKVEEADELVDVARRHHLVLQVGHVERFNPAFSAAVPHAKDPKYIEAVRAGAFTFRSTDIGVVLDLMIHDLDLVLSIVRSPVRKVDALGFSVVGGHEDVANARLEFENGCVATLSASRVSYEAVRRMSIWSPASFAAVDFAARTTTVVEPSETLLGRQFDVNKLTSEQLAYHREHFAEKHLPKRVAQYNAVDALALELDEFLDSIVTGTSPLVTGEAGRDALAVADRILAEIEAHAWDDSVDGPAGPLGRPQRRIIPAPHFAVVDAEAPVARKEAG